MIPGESINLRAVERSDAPLVHRWLDDPVVMRGWGWSASARSLHSVAAELEGWLAEEDGLQRPAALIAETLDGEPIGLVILRAARPQAHSVDLSLLVGDPARWGQGLGKDLLTCALDACFESWGLHRVGIQVEDDNTRALALYRKLGFQEEGRLRQAAFRDGEYADVQLFSLLAAEWSAREEAS